MTTLATPNRAPAPSGERTSTLIYAGVDEAGYGPRLGPLCVAMSVFRIDGWSPSEHAPDLWDLLERAVSRGASHGRTGRIPIADSKKLKRPNSSKSVHPLADLEPGVLAFLRCAAGAENAIDTDARLLEQLGARLEDLPEWYGGAPTTLPLSTSPDLIALRTASLRRALTGAGAAALALRCVVVGEDRFNRAILEDGKAKSEVSFDAVGTLIRSLLEQVGPTGRETEAPRIVIDRQGGRTRYAEELARVIPGARVKTTHECPEISRYLVELGDDRDGASSCKRIVLTVRVQAEDSHLPVALASMTAKYVRELFMHRFNRHWSQRCTGGPLRPTAGYGLDARRWLEEAFAYLSLEDRSRIWRSR